MLNIVLSIDLLFTLRQPFSNPEKRYPYYVGFALTIPICPATIRMIYFNEYGYFYGTVESAFYIVEIFVALASIIRAVFFICQPGTSKKVLKMIIYRHVCYIAVNIIAQLYPVSSMIYLYRNRQHLTGDENYWFVFAYFFFGQGFLLLIVRLTEVEFCKSIWCYVRNFFVDRCRCCSSEDDDEEEE